MLLAHGIGGRQDLPIPFGYALAGAGMAVLASFLVLGLAQRSSVLRGGAGGVALPAAVQAWWDTPALRWALRLVGLVVTGFVAFAAVAGPDTALNPTAGFVYVIFWVGIVPASLALGPIWRELNPLRTVHRLLAALAGRPHELGQRPLPPGVGYWPAAAGLLAFTWLELVAPGATTTALLTAWFGIYGAVHLCAAAYFGSAWFDRCDAFEAYSTLIGRLSPFGRRRDGRLVVRNPFDGLDALVPAPGLVAMVAIMLGSTAYDGFAASPFWVRVVQSAPVPEVLTGTVGLVGTAAVVYVSFSAATRMTGADPLRFAHSIVPIAVGYVVAHYFSLLVFQGQHTLILASDPLGTGANWFGTAGRGIDYTVVSAPAIAAVQVLGVVIGHVLGVIAAHDRAVRLSRDRAVSGQLPLVVLMIGYTVGGLTLLFSG